MNRKEWLQKYIEDGLSQLFTDAATKLADDVDTPDEAAGIPHTLFFMELRLIAAWKQIIDEVGEQP